MKHHAQLQLYDGWGVPSPPAFAFDLLGAAIAKSQGAGLQRYGRNPGAGNDDRRPLAPSYRRVFNPAWVDKGGASAIVGGQDATKALLPVPSYFGGTAGLTFADSRIENPHAFGLPVELGAGESLSFNAFVFPVSKGEDKDSSNGHVWHLRIGDASGGVLFQIRDGNAEVARLSENWNSGGEDQLRLLWALEEPTQGEQEQIESLKKSLYSTFESLSFERSVGARQLDRRRVRHHADSRTAWRASCGFGRRRRLADRVSRSARRGRTGAVMGRGRARRSRRDRRRVDDAAAHGALQQRKAQIWPLQKRLLG